MEPLSLRGKDSRLAFVHGRHPGVRLVGRGVGTLQ